MRGTTLVKLLDMFRSEARLSPNPAHNAQTRDSQVALLQRVQERLWGDFDWPHLRVERKVPIQIGERYYAVPDGIRIERIERVDIFTDGGWRALYPDIAGEHYSAWNSDLDQRSWPPRAWRINEDSMIEVWPIPDTAADATTQEGYLKFTGIRELRPLIADSDRAELDDNIIVLFAAAEQLAADGAKDAQFKLEQANSMYRRARGDLMPNRRFRMFGVGSARAQVRRPIITAYRPPS